MNTRKKKKKPLLIVFTCLLSTFFMLTATADPANSRGAGRSHNATHLTALDNGNEIDREADAAGVPAQQNEASEEDISLEEISDEGIFNVISAFVDRYGSDIFDATYQHIYLVFVSLIIAIMIAVPLGVYLTRCPWERVISGVMGVAGIIQTIPALALIAFIVVFFALFKLPAIGRPPALLALVLYALLPILRNTYTSINQVDPAIKEVARGMGMKPFQVLFKVELPLALPVIMAGIRIAAVWTIGIATLAGLIGAWGLGYLIFRGLSTVRIPLLIAGTVPAAILALVSDWILGRIENWLTPAGLWKGNT